MIVDKEIDSKIIDENKEAIAVLDIKPISKGHSIIIPKKPVKDAKSLPSSSFSLAKKISKKISSKLKSSSCEIQTENKFGEEIINVIPIYNSPLNLNSPRRDSPKEELEKLYIILRIVKKPKVIKQNKPKFDNIIHLPRRIP